MTTPLRITVWNEFRHEKDTTHPASTIYPNGIHAAIAEGLRANAGFTVHTATLDEPEHGLAEAVLAETDVLFWWGHMAHGAVSDAIVERVYARVLDGMGLVVLHSGHFSKIFKKLMGTSCDLKWREADDNERIWVLEPGHPIAAGLGETIELAEEEMYVSASIFPRPKRWCSSAGLRAAKCFAAAAVTPVGAAKSSISAPATKATRPTSTPRCAR